MPHISTKHLPHTHAVHSELGADMYRAFKLYIPRHCIRPTNYAKYVCINVGIDIYIIYITIFCRCFIFSTFRSVNVLVCWLFALSMFLFFRRFGSSKFWFSTFWFTGVWTVDREDHPIPCILQSASKTREPVKFETHSNQSQCLIHAPYRSHMQPIHIN